jgi:hypothetical protein
VAWQPTLITDCDGIDEAPWSQGAIISNPLRVGESAIRRVSNQVGTATSGAGTSSAYYNGATFGDVQVGSDLAVLPNVSSHAMGVCGRITNPNTGTVSFYTVEYQFLTGTDTFTIYRVVNAVFTSLGLVASQDPVAGQELGLEITGSGATVTLQAYLAGVALGAAIQDSSGSRLTAAGNVGLYISAATSAVARFDNLRGSAPPAAPDPSGGGSQQVPLILLPMLPH